MSAVVKQDWRLKTYRELFIQWQEVLIKDWEHTASIMSPHVDSSKTKFSDLHPYLKAPEPIKTKLPKESVLRKPLEERQQQRKQRGIDG